MKSPFGGITRVFITANASADHIHTKYLVGLLGCTWKTYTAFRCVGTLRYCPMPTELHLKPEILQHRIRAPEMNNTIAASNLCAISEPATVVFTVCLSPPDGTTLRSLDSILRLASDLGRGGRGVLQRNYFKNTSAAGHDL